MADNMTIYNAFRTAPPEALKPITGGRLNGFTDISPMWRIKAMTEQFGPCGVGWYIKDVKCWTEAGAGEIAAFVELALVVKIGGEWSAPIYGIGGSRMVAIEKGNPRLDDECYKKAYTDAIGTACKALGMAADVYWDKDRTKYTQPAPESNTATQAAPRQNTKAKKRNEAWNNLRNKYGLDKGALQSIRADMIEHGLLDDTPSDKMTENAYYDMLVGMEQRLVSAGYEART